MFNKTRRSKGIKVTAAVYRLISRGNAARDRSSWPEAATEYQGALDLDPSLTHIWVQLGHALKEKGSFKASEAAYLRAMALAPDDPDPPLHLGHLFNLLGDIPAAGRNYLLSYRADPFGLDAATGLHRVLAHATGKRREAIIGLLRASLEGQPGSEFLPTGAASEPAARPGRTSFVFDTSDLLAYFAHARLPTGIQRVHIETINNTVRDGSRDIHICCVIAGRDEWLEMPAALFLAVSSLCLSGGDKNEPAWIMALNRLHLYLALSTAFRFPHGATLVALGASWSNPNYFMLIRDAMAQSAIRYVPLVYDMIPIVTPEHCVAGHKRDFIYWTLGVFVHAQSFLVISEATRRDLIEVGARLGRRIDPGSAAVIPLDADFRKPSLQVLPRSALSKWRLEENGFVLLVSTIESRKGHMQALEAWANMIRAHGATAVPKLVCVGNKGWLNGAVYRRLKEDEVLASRVRLLQGVTDDELALLYRSCLFTIYPSLYEGWGLPITESFCYGKPVITTTSTSLPEAGGRFAVYVTPGSASELEDAVYRMSTDAAYREGLAATIRDEFRPRSWAAIAAQIETELTRLAARALDAPVVPRVAFGTYYQVARSVATRVWPGLGTGETFRVGTGWQWPVHDGCWTRPEGGELAIGLPQGENEASGRGVVIRIGLMLLGAPEEATECRVRVKNGASLTGTLAQACRRWVQLTAPWPEDGIVRVRLSTLSRPALLETESEDGACAFVEPPTAGVGGFFVHRDDDDATARRMLEAIAFNSIADLDAYRERVPASAWCDRGVGEDDW